MKKLCNELNQMGVKHLIFTLDNVSQKTFGDSDSIKILGEGQEIQHLVVQVLKRAKRVATTKEDENGEVFACLLQMLLQHILSSGRELLR